MDVKVEFSFDQSKCGPSEVMELIEELDMVSERFSKTAETACRIVFHRNTTASVVLEMEVTIFENVFKKFGFRQRLMNLGAVFPN